jgi:hypothetical protein
VQCKNLAPFSQNTTLSFCADKKLFFKNLLTSRSTCAIIKAQRTKELNTMKEKLELALFILECKDHWTDADWKEYHEIQENLKKIS